MPDFTPSQRRDRALARREFKGGSRSLPVDELLGHWLKGPEMARIKKNGALAQALQMVFSEAILVRLRPLKWTGKSLTLEVDDPVLLSELRQFNHQKLLQACADCGTNINRIVYRPRRGSR